MNNASVNVTHQTSATSVTESILISLNIIISFSNFLLGLPTHSYIMWLVVTGNRVSSEIFIFNLSACELGNGLNSLFFALWILFPEISLSYLVSITDGPSITGRPLFQCLMCVECYLAVVHPIVYLKLKPLRYRLTCCSAAWLLTVFSSVFCTVVLNSEILYNWFFSAQFVLFLSVQMFCLVSVLRALKQAGPGERGREEENLMKKRAFHLLLVTTVSMCFTYLPYSVAGFISGFLGMDVNVLYLVAWFCYVLAGFVQPVLYLQRTGKLSGFC